MAEETMSWEDALELRRQQHTLVLLGHDALAVPRPSTAGHSDKWPLL